MQQPTMMPRLCDTISARAKSLDKLYDAKYNAREALRQARRAGNSDAGGSAGLCAHKEHYQACKQALHAYRCDTVAMVRAQSTQLIQGLAPKARAALLHRLNKEVRFDVDADRAVASAIEDLAEDYRAFKLL